MDNRSKWIWSSNDAKQQDQYVYIRKEIRLGNPLGHVTVRVTANEQYKLYINGNRIGTGPSPSNPAYKYYDTYELNIKESSATVAAVCYFIGQDTYMVTEQNQGVGAFRLELEGDGLFEGTDESWNVCTDTGYFQDYIKLGSSRISNWSGYKETFLAEREPRGWMETGYQGDVFRPATVLEDAEKVFIRLLPREIPFLRQETVYPTSVLQTEPYLGHIENVDALLNGEGTFATVDASRPQSFPAIVIDFGREVVGYPEIDVEGGDGCSMAVWYGESLDMMRTDALVMDGTRRVYAPFHRRAFRFMKLVFNNGTAPVHIYAVRLQAVRYDYAREGSFECSNEKLNQIFDVSKYTVQLATQDHFEDSVWREEMQWLADARVMSLVNHWVFGDPRITRKAIRQFFYNQLPDGKVPASGPQPFSSLTIDFDMHLIMMCYEYYYFTLDADFLREIHVPMRLLMDKFASILKDGLISVEIDPVFGVFLDWAVVDKRDRITAINCFYHKTLLDYASMLDVLGDPVASSYREQAVLLRERINRCMYNADRGLFMDCLTDAGLSQASSQQTNLIAVYCGVVDSEKETALIERVYAERNIERIKGAFLLSFIADVLFEKGFEDKAVDMVGDYWGEMLERGATTWWETFDRETPRSCIPYLYSENSATSYIEYIPCSHCHGWGGGPAFFMMKNILGIHPLSPGLREVEFRPYTNGLDYARGVICTPMGDIEVEWKKQPDGSLWRHITAPDSICVVERV